MIRIKVLLYGALFIGTSILAPILNIGYLAKFVNKRFSLALIFVVFHHRIEYLKAFLSSLKVYCLLEFCVYANHILALSVTVDWFTLIWSNKTQFNLVIITGSHTN